MFTIKPVTRARWKDMQILFRAKGCPGYCWCMVFRAEGEELKLTDRNSREGQMRKRVAAGLPVGLLAYAGKEPVGWCSLGPKSTFRRLDGPDPGGDIARVWSLTCFFVKREWRGKGLVERFLAAAIDLAKRRGARILEAYPVAEDSPSYRFMGFVPLFRKHGFAEIGKAGSRRHVMRLALATPRETHASRRSPPPAPPRAANARSRPVPPPAHGAKPRASARAGRGGRRDPSGPKR